LYGVLEKNITRLQRVQNALVRCVVDLNKSQFHHTSSVALLRQLHWLPIEYRIRFKVAKLAFLARSSSTTAHLNSLVSSYTPSRSLRSGDNNLLIVPRSKLVIGTRAFRSAAPTVFNSLPSELRSYDNVKTFCGHLKTFFFNNAFNNP
jgi:hypothetical protein